MKFTRSGVAASALLLTLAGTVESQPRNIYTQHNLVSDLPGNADHLDTRLVNPWGITSPPTGPFWIADNHSGLSTLYDGAGNSLPIVVTIPPPIGGTPPAAPTGIVFNGTANFNLSPGTPAVFLFAAEDGTISGWNPLVDATHAILKVDNSASGAVYKGLALGGNRSGTFLYATNFNAGTVDVFDSNFKPALHGSFQDPLIPAGFAPFGIQNIEGKLFVTYAKQDEVKHDDVAGPGNGFVNVFDLSGNFIARLISGGALNSPWGMALAPGDFGDLSSTLLIGNFGDGSINAFDQSSGKPKGQMLMPSGSPLSIQGLWGLIFGNGAQGGDPSILYFTAGIPGPGAVEDHGLFGEITPQRRQR
jgi:uncharacterized protein (TIGR03118 family)